MKTSANNLYKFGGIVAGSAVMASLSAYITTKYLLKMALDREEPKLMKLAEKKVSAPVPWAIQSLPAPWQHQGSGLPPSRMKP